MLFEDGDLPDEPDTAERQLAAQMGAGGLAMVDRNIRDSAVAVWRKVARVVIDALAKGGFSTRDQAVVCLHVRRVIALVDNGTLEGAGNLHRPRWSEVRVPTEGSDSNWNTIRAMLLERFQPLWRSRVGST